MSRVVSIDLDAPGAEDVERVWAELHHRHAPRRANPRLRKAVLRCASEAEKDGRISPSEAAEIRSQLDEVHPAVVLSEHWRQLIQDRPALGSFAAFPRRSGDGDPCATEWLAADPERLWAVVVESSRFTSDWLKIAEGAARVADKAGIAEHVADPIIADAIRSARQRTQRVG